MNVREEYRRLRRGHPDPGGAIRGARNGAGCDDQTTEGTDDDV